MAARSHDDPRRGLLRLAPAAYGRVAAAIVVAGAVLRLREYLSRRSLWLDESFLALNVIRKDAVDLLGSLDYNQGAAPLFLLAENAVATLGKSELFLRLPPMLAGLAALVLVLPVAARCSSRRAVPVVATALVALSPALVYYSSELKQYSVDAAATLGVALTALVVRERPTPARAAGAALLGLSLAFVSHAATFAVAGAGVVLVVGEVLERRPKLRRAILAVVSAWAVGTFAAVLHATHAAAGVRASYGGSSTAFVTLSDGSDGSETRAVSRFASAIATDLGLPSGGRGFLVTCAIGVVALVGAVVLVRRRPVPALVVLAPIPIAFAAAVADQYPVSARTVLFLAPATAIAVAEGAFAVASLAPRPAFAGAVAALALAATLAHPLRADARLLVQPTEREEQRRLLHDLAAAWRPGDTVYVAYAAQYAFAYYGECGCVGVRLPWRQSPAAGGSRQWSAAIADAGDVRVQPYLRRDWDAYLQAARELPRGRTWIVVSHYGDDEERDFYEGPFVAALDGRGSRLTTLRAHDAAALLYDLR